MVTFLEVGFFPRIHTAIAEWLACMLFILPQKKRFGETSWQQIGCCIGFLALLLGLNLLNQEQSGLIWMLLMAACMGTMLAMIVCCCKLKLMKAGYIWAHAFITAETGYMNNSSMGGQMSFHGTDEKPGRRAPH